ncbi:MAG: cytochrome-c peroxidase [Bradymonadia bacterium]
MKPLVPLLVLLTACSSDTVSDADGNPADGGSAQEEQPDTGPEEANVDPHANAIAALPSPSLPDTLLSYDTPIPEYLQVQVVQLTNNTPPDNPITDAGATLGRVLFYDRRMSLNGEVACASCHDQTKGFSDHRVKSVGFDGGETGRQSMPLINLRHFPRGPMFWDQRAATLEEQVLMPIQDEVEMGMTLDALVERLSATDYYPPLFEAAFGDGTITSDRISRALAQFLRSIVSYGSRFDAEVAVTRDLTVDFPGFTAAENRGRAIFFGLHEPTNPEAPHLPGLCGNCHMFANPTMFVGPEGTPGALPPNAPPLDNLGIFHQLDPINNGFTDPDDDGVGGVTGNEDEMGAFKVSSLRNVALTAPYMHDGRFETLEEVVAHYNEGVEFHPNLGPGLLSFDTTRPLGADNMPTAVRLNLSAEDQAALVAFLHTLTDESIATDERWSDPFPN